MTRYTPNHALPAPEGSDPVVVSGDLWSLAYGTEKALGNVKASASGDATIKSNRARVDAIADAASKYGQLPEQIATQGIRLDGTEGRVEALEVIAGLEPGNISDATMADIAANPATLFAGQLKSDVASVVAESAGVNIRDFGAVGDGVTDDTAAVQAFWDYLGANGGKGVAKGSFLHKAPISLNNPARGFVLETAGRDGTQFLFRGTADVSATSFTGLHDTIIHPLTFDGGYSQTGHGGHGFSIRNPRNVVLNNVHVRNYRSSAGLLFADVPGIYGGNYLNFCSYDGGGVANNGFLFVDLVDSYMVNPVCVGLGRGLEYSPSYAAQLKNGCRNSHIIDAIVDGAEGGLVMASDMPDGGPENCSITGNVRNADQSVLMGKTKNSTIRAQVDMGGDPANNRAVAIGANCSDNVVSLSITNPAAGATPIFLNSSNNTVIVEHAAGFGPKLVELGEGVQGNKVILQSLAGSPVSAAELVTDNSGRTNNVVTLVASAFGMEALSSTGTSYERFVAPGNSNTWLAYNHASNNFIHRIRGTDRLTLSATDLRPGLDISQSLGTSGRRWTQVFAQNGAISTSDGRDKQQIDTELAPELRAWSRVEYSKFKFNDAVERKGAGARWHFGVIAQQVKEAFEAEGLDPFAYGILCYDQWEAQPEDLDEDGNVISEAVQGGERYGIRYEEALALEAAYLRSRVVSLAP